MGAYVMRKVKAAPRSGFTCEIRVTPYNKTPGASVHGGQRWTWPQEGPATAECGYRCHTEHQLLAHLVVTHRIPLAQAKQSV